MAYGIPYGIHYKPFRRRKSNHMKLNTLIMGKSIEKKIKKFALRHFPSHECYHCVVHTKRQLPHRNDHNKLHVSKWTVMHISRSLLWHSIKHTHCHQLNTRAPLVFDHFVRLSWCHRSLRLSARWRHYHQSENDSKRADCDHVTWTCIYIYIYIGQRQE